MPAKNSSVLSVPPDQAARTAALDPDGSFLVQAPAGSGKTDLLTRRFLRLLATVDDPGQIVAITFTRAAAAEMRHRILAELEKANSRVATAQIADEFSMEALAARALERSRQLDWRLLDLVPQLRISTIDSFCRDIAIQQPIHSGIGNNLQIGEMPTQLYSRAAQATLQKLGDTKQSALSDAIKELLLWRDNGWKELESLLVTMLGQRDRWMHAFVLGREPDWNAIREWLERPLANTVRAALESLSLLLNQVPGAGEEAISLARFACLNGADDLHRDLAELTSFPYGPHPDSIALEDARNAYLCLRKLLLTNEDRFRRQFTILLGFPKESREEKLRIQFLSDQLAAVPGLEDALAAVRHLPPARYTEEDWQIIRASFIVLRHAAGELKAIFAETGTVDFVEVAQIARDLLRGEDQFPTEAAIAVADNIHHLLVDEFQDTSRRQHELISALINAWPDRSGRSIFLVGDPVQSIYSFRDAEAELFGRVQQRGFEFTQDENFALHHIRLTANFRTDPILVETMNQAFAKVFAAPDGSGIDFNSAEPARGPSTDAAKRFHLHLAYAPQSRSARTANSNANSSESAALQREAAKAAQLKEIVALVRSHLPRIEAARSVGEKYRVAVLGRARTALAPIAKALREAQISFRAVELESLQDRPEILDAVSLARAVSNLEDRVAWLGVLRAPWCGLSLAELHAIAGADAEPVTTATIPELLRQRLHLLSPESQNAAERVLAAFAAIPHLRNALTTASIGTLLQQLWRSLGGDRCVDAGARANLDLFWKLLDNLPGGEQDLHGPALNFALNDLFSLPDPASSSECGVQLMTIHKSKGLEFEVVIVPDLQALGGASRPDLLSWLERGILDPDDSHELTEFLIAPLQFKGSDRGLAKAWVDSKRREREDQETRRILYVAATRAREELHFFAQPSFKVEADQSRALIPPRKSLLCTAWPALEEEINTHFAQWSRSIDETAEPGEISSIAAAESNVTVMTRPTVVRRLRPDFKVPALIDRSLAPAEPLIGLGDEPQYQRHEGGLVSRALGNAVHKLLEELARLRVSSDWDASLAALDAIRPRITAAIRTSGISRNQAEDITAKAFEIARNAANDPSGRWILSPHPEAASESGWAGIVGGGLRLVRVDRLFRAGLVPIEPGNNALWIIDYKTAHPENLSNASTIQSLRDTYAPQLQAYAGVLRNLYGAQVQLRAGLYFPRVALFDWWEI